MNNIWDNNNSKTMSLNDYKNSLHLNESESEYFHRGSSLVYLERKITSEGIIFEKIEELNRYITSEFILESLIRYIDNKAIMCVYIEACAINRGRLIVFPDFEIKLNK